MPEQELSYAERMAQQRKDLEAREDVQKHRETTTSGVQAAPTAAPVAPISAPLRATPAERPPRPVAPKTVASTAKAGQNGKHAEPPTTATREKLVPITISVPESVARRARALENRLYDGRDRYGLKGKQGPSALFKMGLDYLEQAEEDELFECALRHSTY